jgi:hypothetical protein
MKTIHHLAVLSFALALFAGVLAAGPLAGPGGGRILTNVAPHAEFLVDADRHVVIRFYDADLKPLAPSGQLVSATAEAKPGKAKLEFAERDGALVSNTSLPEGEGYRIVVQIRENPNARPANYRVDFHDEICGECQRAEYACTCEGHEGDAHGHGH